MAINTVVKDTQQKEKNEMWLVTNHVSLGNIEGSNATNFLFLFWLRLKANYFNTMWYICHVWGGIGLWVFTILLLPMHAIFNKYSSFFSMAFSAVSLYLFLQN